MAHELSKRLRHTVRPEEIRRQNMYRSSDGKAGDVDATHFGQPLWFCDLREQWDRIHATSDLRAAPRPLTRSIGPIAGESAASRCCLSNTASASNNFPR